MSALKSLREDITAAIAACPGTDFHFVRLHQWQSILERIAERFLTHGVQSLSKLWIWECLACVTASSHPENALEELERRLSGTERYWFIAGGQNGKYWLADAGREGILKVLQEMYYFEYGVVDRKMTWLFYENHHGALMEAAPKPTAP